MKSSNCPVCSLDSQRRTLRRNSAEHDDIGISTSLGTSVVFDNSFLSGRKNSGPNSGFCRWRKDLKKKNRIDAALKRKRRQKFDWFCFRFVLGCSRSTSFSVFRRTVVQSKFFHFDSIGVEFNDFEQYGSSMNRIESNRIENLFRFLVQPVEEKKCFSDRTCSYRFENSPIMSTYIVAFIIGSYEFIETEDSNGVLIRVYTPIGKKEAGRFALEVRTVRAE